MKKISKIFNLTGLSLLLLATCSCGSDNSEDTSTSDPSDFLTYEDVFAVGNDLISSNEGRIENVLSTEKTVSDEDQENGTTIRTECITETVDLKNDTGEFNLFDSSEVVFPGNLLQGKTLSEAVPSPIVVKRAGGTISININNTGNQSAEVDEVKQSTIQEAIGSILDSSTEEAPANFNFEFIDLQSEEQLAVELGINVQVFRVKVSNRLKFNSQKEFNSTLVKLDQKMFTINFDLPTDIEQIFDESVTPQDLSRFVQADNPATFISSVTFGRIFYMLIESTSESIEINNQVNASFRGLTNSVNTSLNVNALQSLENLKIQVIAYGGPSSSSFNLIGVTSIEAIADELGQSSVLNAALPISYTVRSVQRPDQVAGLNLTTQFERTDCLPKGLLPKAGYQNLVDIFGPEDSIGAAFNIKDTMIAVYNKAGDKYAIYDVGLAEILGRFDHNDPSGPLGESDLANVGAGFKHTEAQKNFTEGTTVVLVDNGGLRAQRFTINKDFDSNAPDVIGSYNPQVETIASILSDSDDAFGFPGDGIKAASGLPFRFADNNRMSSIAFSEGSPRFMQNLFSSSGRMSNVEVQNISVLGTADNPMFSEIGAAAIVRFSPTSEQLLLINEEGDLMMYLSDLDARKGGGGTNVYRIVQEARDFRATYSGRRVLK